MDSNPIHHPSPPKKMKCSFLDYIQLLMIGRAGQWTETPSATSLQPKTWNATFWITFNFWWSAGLVNGLKPHPPPLSSQKKWNAHFCITFNIWCWPDWSMDLNLIHHLSPAKNMKCSFLDYVELLMISRPCQWTWTPSTTCLQPKKLNAHILIMFTSDDVPGWLMNLNFICHPSPPIKMKCSIFNYVQLLMISQAGQFTQSPSASLLQPRKWNAHFWIMFNFWWSAGPVNGLKPYLPALSSQ